MKKQRVLLVIGFSALTFIVIKQSIDIHYLSGALNQTIEYLKQQRYDEQFQTIVDDLGDIEGKNP